MKTLTIVLVVALAVSAQGYPFYNPFTYFHNLFNPCPPGTYRPANMPSVPCVACTIPDPSCVAPGLWNPNACKCDCMVNFQMCPFRRICVCSIDSCVNGQPVNETTCTCPP